VISDQEVANVIPLFSFIADECEETGIKLRSIELPWLVFGIGSRESGWGTARAYVDVDGVPDDDIGDGVGDHGHGRGLMQIDDRWHPDFIASGKWRDSRENIRYAIRAVLKPNWVMINRWWGERDESFRIFALLSSYNCGLGNVRKAVRAGQSPEHFTTGRNYATDVLARAHAFKKAFTMENLIRLVPRPPDPLT
jgi:hypothetical protein